MDESLPHDLLAPWHDFFTIIGSASATLVGLMFVAASVGSGVFTEQRQAGLRTFLSPTVVAFSATLGASLIGVLPADSWAVPGLLLAVGGLLGIFYSVRVWRHMVREGIAEKIDLEDRIWYTIVPAFAYSVLTVTGLACGVARGVSCDMMAIGMGLLLLAGIRNAWDMTTWVVMRRRE